MKKTKKLLLLASFAAIGGLSVYSTANTHLDLGIEEKNQEKTYIVRVKGDVKSDDADKLRSYRNTAINQLRYILPEGSFEVTHVYDTVLNGFAVKVNSYYADELENLPGVREVSESHTYALPQSESTLATGDLGDDHKAERLANYSAQTMSATASDVQNAIGSTSSGGKYVTIGILDTGLYLNQIEGSAKRVEDETNYTLNAAAFKDLGDADVKYSNVDVQALGFNSNYYSHYNNKIFFARDYVGNDNNVDPTKAGSEHGTHVASLAAANGDDFQGIAPNAQIAVLKVFGDDQAGAPTESIIAAINDAAKLKLDVINLSLGTDLYTESDTVDDMTYLAVKGASDAGVIVNFAAGNSGKSSFSSSKTYSDWTTDTVETSILGNDAHYDEVANIVGSSNPDRAFFSSILTVTQTGSQTTNAVSYSDQAKRSATQLTLTDRPLAGLIEEGQTEKTLDYVVIPGVGRTSDYTDLDVQGKVAVVHRGTLTFVNKVRNAAAAGAVAMICINNDPSVTFNFSMDFSDYDPPIPVVFVFQNTTAYFGGAGQTGSLTIGTNSVQTASDGNTISSFSSDGGEYNLDMGVTISAPGKEIIGAVDATYYNDNSDSSNPGYSLLRGYENMSGTSMATPNLTGAMALYLGEKNPQNASAAAVADENAYKQEKNVLSMKAMASADQLVDTTGAGVEASPRLQGAGRINVKKMLKSNTYLTSVNSDLDGFENQNQAKVELKNSGTLFEDDFSSQGNADANYIEFEYTVHNDSNAARTYTPSLSVMIPSLRVNVTHDEYEEEEASSRAETIGYDSSVTFDPDDLSTYPYGVGKQTMSVNDDILDVPAANIEGSEEFTVAANSSITKKIKVRIDNLTLSKDWGDSKLINFYGTLKQYMEEFFSDAGGTYVEGYLTLQESTASDLDVSMPYLGFYGDYTKGEAVEPFDFEKKEGRLYNSDLVDNYMQNMNETYAKKNAYTGSTLSSTGSSLGTSALNQIGNMNTSAKANGVAYQYVTGEDGDTTIYAGAEDISDHLISVFFVNRSCTGGRWAIKNASGTAVKSGNISDLYLYGDTFTTMSGSLSKSWLVTTTSSSTPYALHRGYADIDLSKVDEGSYTLEYSFTLAGTGTTQTRSYNLVVDKTAPTLEKLEIVENGERKNLSIRANGAGYGMAVNNSSALPSKVDGTTDSYQASIRLRDTWIDNGYAFVELEDYAHNNATILVDLNNIDFSVASTFFTDKQQATIARISSLGGVYTYEVFIEQNGNTIEPSGDYIIYMQLKTGLDVEDIILSVDGEPVDVEDINYNAETGMLAIHMNKDSVNFTINQPSISQSTDPINPPSPGTSDNTESSNGGTSNDEPVEPERGCSGSLVATSSTIGALALLTAGIALKKKREDK